MDDNADRLAEIERDVHMARRGNWRSDLYWLIARVRELEGLNERRATRLQEERQRIAELEAQIDAGEQWKAHFDAKQKELEADKARLDWLLNPPPYADMEQGLALISGTQHDDLACFGFASREDIDAAITSANHSSKNKTE